MYFRVYDDAVDAIKCWTASGKQVYIFSSGSVEAQKLLFGYTEKGDLSAVSKIVFIWMDVKS